MVYRIFPNLGFRIYKHFHFPCQSPVPHHRYSLALQPRPERLHHFRTPCHEPRAGPAPNATSAFPPRVPRPHRRAEGRGSARVAATEPQGPSPAPASPGRRRPPLKGAGKTSARPRLALGRRGRRQRPTLHRGGLRRGEAGRGSGWAGLQPAWRCRRAGLLPFPAAAAPAAAALPGRRGGGAEAPRRLLLFSWAPLGAVSLGSEGVNLSRFLSAPHSRRLTTTAAAAAGGAWRFEAERRRGEGRGGGGAEAGGGAACPGTERPRPWRTPIFSSTLSSATQVSAAGGGRRPPGRGWGAHGVWPRRGSCRRRAPPPRPRRSISAVLELVTWALREAAAWPGRPGPPPRPRPCSWGPRPPFRRAIWGVYERRAGPARGCQSLALRIARPAPGPSPWASSPTPREESGAEESRR